jgi:ribosomal-protein-alanine N-acetyltransferase
VERPDGPVVIETERLVLYLPPLEEAPLALDFMERNREHLEPWSPRRPQAFYTLPYWEAQMARNRLLHAEGRALRTFARLRADAAPRLVAACNLNDIVRGSFQAGTLGYSMDAELQGRGLVTEALRGLVAYAFETLRLHRVMANHLPHNAASEAVLRKLGFEVEGYARDYLEVDGRWQDHVLNALTNPDRPANG